MPKKKRTKPKGLRKQGGTLNARQQRFVQEYLVDGNGTRAAIAAGFSRKSASSMAIQTIKKPHVAKAIAEGQAKVDAKCEITAEKLRNMLLVNHDKAQAAGAFMAANKAVELLGRSHPGFFIDRRELSGPGGGPIPIAAAAMTAEQLAALTDKELNQLEAISRKVLPDEEPRQS